MTPIGEVLQPDHVNLTLAASDPAGAVEEVLAKLDGDERVKNLAILREAVLKEAAPAISVTKDCPAAVASEGRNRSLRWSWQPDVRTKV